MSSTDYLRLSEHKIFKNVRDTLPESFQNTQNVMAVGDDIMFVWNFQDNCVLALNIKAARSREGDNFTHQTLLPMSPPFFKPNHLIVNSSNTLLIAFGPNGVLVFELPDRSPPYGCFSYNKEMIYCRSHSLHERTLAFNTRIEVRQVKFHPGSPNDSHIIFLTSDNIFRIYNVENGTANNVGTYGIGLQPKSSIPSSKVSALEILGETAVDFDFDLPKVQKFSHINNLIKEDDSSISLPSSRNRITDLSTSLKTLEIKQPKGYEPRKKNSKNSIENPSLVWPIFVLYGNGELYTISIKLGDKCHPGLKGPHFITPKPEESYSTDFCSILCIPNVPPILALANCRGRICHVLVLPYQEDDVNETNKSMYNKSWDDELNVSYLQKPEKSLLLLEVIELELGLSTTEITEDYVCPIFLHRDVAKLGFYFASHETGVHAITISCVDNLQAFLNSNEDIESLEDLMVEETIVEYLLCTKTSSCDEINPVIGFSIYHDPHSLMALLKNGQFISLAVLTIVLPQNNFEPQDMETMTSPLKQMLTNPFDALIQRILRQSSTQPILKLSSKGEHSQQECYELLQRAAQVFREEHFKNHDKAREEIEKRVKALRLLKEFQMNEINRMIADKQSLQENAENLAEKYEDLKDKQEDLSKRCEILLVGISKRQTISSKAEEQYHEKLKQYGQKIEKYKSAITRLRQKMKYQELQMQNFNTQNQKKKGLGSAQSDSIRLNLQDMTNKIANMVKEVSEYKDKLNII